MPLALAGDRRFSSTADIRITMAAVVCNGCDPISHCEVSLRARKQHSKAVVAG